MTGRIDGMKELYDKLGELGNQLEAKALRSSAMAALTRTAREYRAAAPRGSQAHRTYKGRLVAPGFLSRSIVRRSRVDKKSGRVWALIGVRREAFYGVMFLDKGIWVRSRRGQPVRPYRIEGRDWFKSRFESNVPQIISVFTEKLKDKIRTVAR
ncbi:hypothetical protein [Methylophaga lonarensis]|uniref:hypothetical protein n=1 Tax=Methylophaga lonarensis TaxID=999151 RepID=UPI003D288C3A